MIKEIGRDTILLTLLKIGFWNEVSGKTIFDMVFCIVDGGTTAEGSFKNDLKHGIFIIQVKDGEDFK